MADNDKTVGSRRGGNNDKTVGGRRGRGNDDVHSTARATRPTRGNQGEQDEHSTTRATRGQTSNADEHSTAKGSRGQGGGSPRPYEQKNGFNRDLSAGASSNTGIEWPDIFILDGVKYKNEGVLSSSSGEAIVFTVSRGGKKFALKLYYYDPEHRPNHTVLEKIRNLSGSGLLVNIVSHGEWDNPNMPGEKNDYELMDFCEGGSLDGIVFDGNEKGLTEVAVRMAAAIDFLAKHGILHRDIKPANFFYADKKKTQIVLADFGISVECPEGGVVKIDEMRSPVYAAPEFYANVPGEPAEVGVESDYFSLGVALLSLWMGKDKLTANESQLLRSKLNETLPMPKNMSAHMASLIKALTRLKMSDRANFEDIKRWVKGESLDNDRSDDGSPDFKVVFNSSKNQIAYSPAELAEMLVEDKVLGKKYIYSGRVTRWLEETGRNELAVNVEEIVEKQYPKNQEAGLWSVAYLLDPALDYVAPDGEKFSDPASIALHIFTNSNELGDEVLNPDSTLMIYLRALKLDKTIATVRNYIDSDSFDKEYLPKFNASLYLAVLLNQDMLLPVSTEEDWEYVDTVDELLEVLHSQGEIDNINSLLLTSQAFIVWLSYRRPELAGKIRVLHDNSNLDKESIYYNAISPYRIAYELDPRADLNFSISEDNPDRVYDIPQIGRYLNNQLIEMSQGKQDTRAFFDKFVYMDSSKVGDYLRARGEAYTTFLSWNQFCMDIENEDNKQKAGPYDVVIAAYKSVAGFLQEAPEYVINDVTLGKPDDLAKMPSSLVKNAMGGEIRYMPSGEGKPVAWLDAWLTVFYQENPLLDLSTQFTYEKETAKYIEFIGRLVPDDYYFMRYKKAIKRVDNAASKLKRSERSLKLKRNIFLLLGLVPTLIMLICSWFLDFPDGNPINGHFMVTFGICSLAFWISMATFSGFGAGFLPGVFGGLVSTGFAYAGYSWFPSIFYIIVGIALVIGAVLAIKYLFHREKVDTNGLVIKGDEFEYRQLDALYFAYHQKDDNIENVVTEYSELQRNDDAVTKENISYVGGLWLPLVWMCFIIWYFATPELSRNNAWMPQPGVEKAEPGSWVLGRWEIKYPVGSVRIICNIDSIRDGKYIYGNMVIAGQAPVSASGSVRSENDTIPKSFSFKVNNNQVQRQSLSIEYVAKDKSFRGYYYDRKGIMNSIRVVSTPLDKKDAQTSQPTQSTTKKSSGQTKSKKTESQKENSGKDSNSASKPESDNLLENEESPVSGLWQDTM